MQISDAFRAMDTDIDVIVEADDPAFDATLSVRLLFEQQEAKFSRFRASSLLGELNRGGPVADAHFAAACRMAVEAFEMTGGIFNPMVLPALREAGYDRTFGDVAGGTPRRQAILDPRDCLAFEEEIVQLRAGQLDLGGIVKGWSVDRAVELLRDRFAGVFVNAGGDLRCTGHEEGCRDGWLVEVEAPKGTVAWEGEWAAAMATSTVAKRRWTTADGGVAHHLIDPRTGEPADAPFAQVTARGPLTWRAEVWAKSVLIGGETLAERAVTDGYGVLAIAGDGRVRRWEWPI
jgi:thiamine biosynthesis lipoprotein